MTKKEFDPANALGEQIAAMGRQELCAFVVRLCHTVRQEVGNRAYHGGIYPENIGRDADGELSIGEGHLEAWKGQELDFVAPELYWNGQCSPASDVYSLGLLLYYGVTGGRLPFEGESPNAQLSRMSGKEISAPKAAGGRLGEVIEKALRFQEGERYQTVEELEIMLESCLDNKYLGGENGAEAIFKKDSEDLSDIERMMVAIISGGSEDEPEAEAPAEPVEQLSAEEAMAEILDTAPEKQPVKEEKDPFAFVKEFFSDPETEAPAAAEAEDVRVYEPSRHEKAGDQAAIPILTEEKNPELEPVVLRPGRVSTVNYGQSPERNRQIAENVRKRRKRPLLVVLILCALLVAAALIANALLRDYDWNRSSLPQKDVSAPPVGENAPQKGENGTGAIVQATPDPLIPQQSVYYQVFVDDCSWIDAKAKAEEIGGHLVVITSQQELERVAEAVGSAGIPRAWIGCHRVDGTLVWETSEYVGFFNWDDNEPSGTDAYDGAPEDFVMLVNNNRWVYNDCRNDPAGELPEYYSGTMGYVVEFGIGE